METIHRAAFLTGAATGIAGLAALALPTRALALTNGSTTIQISGLQSILRDSQGRVLAIVQSRFPNDPRPTLEVNPDFVARLTPTLNQIHPHADHASPMVPHGGCGSARASYNWALAGFVAAGIFLVANPIDPIAIGLFIIAEGAVSSARQAVADAGCG